MCIAKARGDYVWLVGDDEELEENAVRSVCEILLAHAPDLVIAEGSDDRAMRTYGHYGDFLAETCRCSFRAALRHTLISANIFRRAVFDLDFAAQKLYTQYAHMFGLMIRLNGRVCRLPHVIRMRPVRAAFAVYPSCLCVKQALYLWFLSGRFGKKRFKAFALKCACNLPIEYLSRLKNVLMGRGRSA